jgi:hypothetical protein
MERIERAAINAYAGFNSWFLIFPRHSGSGQIRAHYSQTGDRMVSLGHWRPRLIKIQCRRRVGSPSFSASSATAHLHRVCPGWHEEIPNSETGRGGNGIKFKPFAGTECRQLLKLHRGVDGILFGCDNN